MYTAENLEKKIQEFLSLLTKDSKLQKLYTFKISTYDELDSALLIKLTSEPFLIGYDSEVNRLYFDDENGDRSYCPEINEGLTKSKEWISDFLPSVPIDINQNGNIRKAKEAENIYKCILVSGILREDFLIDFKKVCKTYDFKELRGSVDHNENFSALLDKWQSLQNITIRVIVSGANYKLASEKNLEVGFLLGSLSKEETLGVSSIRNFVKSCIRTYMLGKLSPDKVNQLSKIERLKEIQKKDDEVLSIINESSEFSELYKICAMTVDYLDPFIKIRLDNSAIDFAKKEAAKIYKNDEEGLKKFTSICRRRAYKEALISLKNKELDKWRLVTNAVYKLPSKI